MKEKKMKRKKFEFKPNEKGIKIDNKKQINSLHFLAFKIMEGSRLERKKELKGKEK